MNKLLRKILIPMVLLPVALSSLASCTYSKTDASSAGCTYNGGPLDDRLFRGYIEPGTGRENQGMMSEVVEYPIRVVQLSVKSDGTGDKQDVIYAKVKGVDQGYEPTLTFTLNTEIRESKNGPKPVACDLIEKHLKPLGATDFNDGVDSEWVREFLNARVFPVLKDVATRVLQGYDPTKLAYNTGGERDAAAQEISDELTEALEQSLGDQYFCQPSYQFGGSAAECGQITVVLPEPKMSDEDAKLIAAPQRAFTEANNAIAVATEEARQASEIANQREAQAKSAEQLADAEEQIATQQGRVAAADVEIDYAWCQYLVSLGQRCDLVAAAEAGDYPDVVLGSDAEIPVAIPLPVETTPAP